MVEEQSPEPPGPEPPPTEEDQGTTSRRWLPLGLVVLASVLALVSVFAVWANRQLLETDSWVETSSELLEDEEIRGALAGYLVDELYANVDVEGEIEAALPEEVAPLAGPAAGALRQGADQLANELLARPGIQGLWEDANRAAHETFIAVIKDEGDVVSTSGGVVTLDLGEILGQISEQVGIPGDLASKLPEDAGNLEILRSEELEAAQEGAALLETLAWVFTVLALGLYALAVYIAGDRRRETLRAVGVGFFAVGAIVLIIRGLAGDAVVESLTESATDVPAVEATWSIATGLLEEAGGAMILYGIGIVLAAWIAGPTGPATSLRRALAPYLRQPRFAWGGLFVLLILLFLWNPTPATERFLPSLILIALLALGVEMLRRQTAVEFPERVTTFSAAGMAQTMASQTRESIARRVSARTERQESEAAASRLDALERLSRLREDGVLSDEEFAAEKAKLVGSPDTSDESEEE